mmetsp:Transcript_68823/g.193013  ORF Transcript_68823/g.193013 Transcript_68823/m.193013 type:complete len:215 (+) Transcript_68823:62-706(+)
MSVPMAEKLVYLDTPPGLHGAVTDQCLTSDSGGPHMLLEHMIPMPDRLLAKPDAADRPLEQLRRPADGLTGKLRDPPPAAPEASLTTLMLRNIPGRYTKQALAEDIGPFTWDLLYLPGGCGWKTNRNYAFINFATTADASSFRSLWHRQRLPRFHAQKRLNICYAALQGFHANWLLVQGNRAGNPCEELDCYCMPVVRAPAPPPRGFSEPIISL